MAKITPEGVEIVAKSNPLKIDEIRREEMVAKAKELLNGIPMEFNDLLNELEKYYISVQMHYTAKQLKDIITQVQSDLAVVVDPAI